MVDGIAGGMNIANLFSSKFKNLLNKHPPSSRSDLLSQINSSLCESHLCEMDFLEDEVIDAIHQLKSSKSDADGVFTNHLKLACPVIAEPLALWFSTILRHGYMLPVLRDCVLVPIPKGVKDTSSSLNYRPIALSSNLSKVLERLILLKFIAFFTSSELQFGFKPGFSTTLCTGVVKNIISHYINKGSCVLGCFLDASKAFVMVDHTILFRKLVDRGLPLPVVRLLLCWYCSQQTKVRWGSCVSESFCVSNGVRQGSVLSPFLFAVYLDGLLSESICWCCVLCRYCVVSSMSICFKNFVEHL